MLPLGFTPNPAPVPDPHAAATPPCQLHIEDVLATPRRLWLRGRLVPPQGTPAAGNGDGRRWAGWWRKSKETLPLAQLHLETRVSGQILEADVPLRADGRFEALLSANLPPVQRGWRVARNKVTGDGFQAEKCGVVLLPPQEAAGAVVVVLPLAFTLEASGAAGLERSEAARRLAPVLRGLCNGPGDIHSIYYLACISQDADGRAAELSLAAATLGWPHAPFILLHAEPKAAPATLAEGIDRLRWLLSGTLPLAILNLEPGLTPVLAGLSEAEDRATVRLVLGPNDDAAKLLGGPLDGANGLAPSPPRRTRSYLVPRHPVVFCHGMLAMSTVRRQLPEDLNCFTPLREFLRARGFRVLFPQVLPTAGVARRAEQLREQVLRWTDGPFNLIAHSMGGLDARHMITHLGMAERVRSLTTVATSHRGTYLADWFLTNFRNRVPLLLAMEAMGINVDGFRDCRPDACREFNDRTPDRPEVRYFSYGGAVSQGRVSPMLRRAWQLLTPIEGPNDGMVAVASARWGEYLGTINADHYAQTPDSVFLRPGEDFDAVAFYSRLLEDLARRGF